MNAAGRARAKRDKCEGWNHVDEGMAASFQASRALPKAGRKLECLCNRSGKNPMQLPEFARSTTLRWTVLVAAIFVAIIVAMLGFVYLKAKHDLTMRSDRMIASQMGVFADLSPERRLDAIDEHLKQDPWRVRLAALFDPSGRRVK